MFQRYLLRTAADTHAASVEQAHHIGVILSRHDDVYTALRTCVVQEKNSGVTVANLIFLEMYHYTHLQTLHIITGDNNAMHHQDKHKYQGLLFSHTSTITSVRVVEKEQGGARKFCSIEELID